MLDKKESPHTRTLQFFDEDPKIQYVISDSQGRIREMFKGYYSEFMIVHQQGDSLTIQKSFVTGAEGEDVLREKTMGPENYIYFIREIIPDRDTFIRGDILQIVSRNNSNTSLRAVTSTLEWLVDGSMDPKRHKQVDDFVCRVLVLMAHFMQYNIEANRHRDLAYVLSTLKNLFLSTRSVDPDLIKVREMGEKIVTEAQGKMSTSLMMATRTAVIFYICARALIVK